MADTYRILLEFSSLAEACVALTDHVHQHATLVVTEFDGDANVLKDRWGHYRTGDKPATVKWETFAVTPART